MKRRISGFALYRFAFSFLPHRGKYLLGVALGSCELALLFALPYVNQALIDIVTGVNDENILLTLLMLLCLFLLLVPPVVYGNYLQSVSAAQGLSNLNKTMFDHILHLPHSALTGYKTGDYITRLTNDANRSMNTFRSFGTVNLIRFTVVFPAALILLIINDWHIAAAGIVYGGINLALSMYLNPLAKRMDRDAKEEIAGSASFLIEALRAIPVIRVFVMHKVMAERYQKICAVIRKKRIKYQNIIGITYGVVDFFAQSAQAVGFLLGVFLAGSDTTLGNAVFNATLMGMMADSVYRLSTFLLLAQPNLVSMERVRELLSLPLEDLEQGETEVDTEQEIAVELENVCFSYDGKTNAIDHLDLFLRKGEHLAIVGGSGGGKSTVVKLLEGFYPPDSGTIRYFGKTGLSLSTIRQLFAYVPQECTLFDGSIEENIRLGNQFASREEVEHAAELADIHEFIKGLPEGYGTQVGERGNQLSGGQKQRIAIARAILKGAPILLLDEATASLDSASEKEVQRCLDHISAHMTTVTVAHRLSTIENADRILVMEAGRIVEEGTFRELLDRNGPFRELYESQQKEK